MLKPSASPKKACCNLHTHPHKFQASLIHTAQNRHNSSAFGLWFCCTGLSSNKTRAILPCSVMLAKTFSLVGCKHNHVGGVQDHMTLTCLSSSFPLPVCNSALHANGLREGLDCASLEMTRREGGCPTYEDCLV